MNILLNDRNHFRSKLIHFGGIRSSAKWEGYGQRRGPLLGANFLGNFIRKESSEQTSKSTFHL